MLSCFVGGSCGGAELSKQCLLRYAHDVERFRRWEHTPAYICILEDAVWAEDGATAEGGNLVQWATHMGE